MFFKENEPYFKTDVYYYTNHKSGATDVFYHAETLRLLGYKEKQKDYVALKRNLNFLKMIPSTKHKLTFLSYETRYINVTKDIQAETKEKSIEKLYRIFDSLIRNHIRNLKNIITGIKTVMSRITNFDNLDLQLFAEKERDHSLYHMIMKHSKNIKDIELNDAFSQWRVLQEELSFQSVEWDKINLHIDLENEIVIMDLINDYDITSNILMYYLTNEMIKIIDANPNKVTQGYIVRAFIDIINYFYSQYNYDNVKNNLEIKRFEYILNASDMLIDMMKKGQGLDTTLEKGVESDEEIANNRVIQGETSEGDAEEEQVLDDVEASEALDAEGVDIMGDAYAEEYSDDYAGGGYESD
jgi:hypothetical protein